MNEDTLYVQTDSAIDALDPPVVEEGDDLGDAVGWSSCTGSGCPNP